MSAKEIRAQARKDLSGKWGKVILLNILFILAGIVVGLLNVIPILGSILSLLLIVPLTYGYTANLMNLKRGDTESVTEFFNIGLSNFKRSWGVTLHSILKVLLPVILLVVISVLVVAFGLASLNQNISESVALVALLFFVAMFVVEIWYICRALLLTLTDYIAIDNESMSTKDSVEKSMEKMKGNRLSYIWLGLTFLGWYLLSMLTLGIGLIWLIPYVAVSQICFYESIVGKKENTTESKEVEEKKEEPKEETIEE